MLNDLINTLFPSLKKSTHEMSLIRIMETGQSWWPKARPRSERQSTGDVRRVASPIQPPTRTEFATNVPGNVYTEDRTWKGVVHEKACFRSETGVVIIGFLPNHPYTCDCVWWDHWSPLYWQYTVLSRVLWNITQVGFEPTNSAIQGSYLTNIGHWDYMHGS